MTKYYAGIGSRKTPDYILEIMTRMATILEEEGYVLRSGGARGADSAFETGTKNLRQIFLPWKNFNENKSILHNCYSKDHEAIAELFHPRYKYLSISAKKFMIRNTAQILGLDIKKSPHSKFVVCWTSDGKDSGGTGQAIRIAKSYEIPVYNLKNDPTLVDGITDKQLKDICCHLG